MILTSMKAIAHHTKWGYGSLILEIIEATKVISHASYVKKDNRQHECSIERALPWLGAPTTAIEMVANANGSPIIWP